MKIDFDLAIEFCEAFWPSGDRQAIVASPQIQITIARHQYRVHRRSPDGKDNKVPTKDVLIVWIGKDVGTMEKAKKKAHSINVAGNLKPFHCEIEARRRFNEAEVRARIQPNSGSHTIYDD